MKPKKGKIVESKAEILLPSENQPELDAVNAEPAEESDNDAKNTDADAKNTDAEIAAQSNAVSPAKPSPTVANKKGRWWLSYLITAAVLSVLTVLIAWGQGVFQITDKKFLLGELSTAFFVPGIFALGFGLLILCSNGGAFDIFAYGIMAFFRAFKKDPLDRKYGGYYQYRKAQREKKRSFWYMVIVGGVFVLIGGALLWAYHAA